jgi:hypothetical protein
MGLQAMTDSEKSMKTLKITLSRTLLKLRAFMSSPLAFRLVLLLFVLQTLFLVFTVRIGTPPDEGNHVHFIQYYANHSLSPVFDHQQPTQSLGDKTREVDYLYHYVMSLVARILPLQGHPEIIALRLFSVLFGLLALVTLARVLTLLGLTAGVITGSLLLIGNLPMVLMLSSAVNNDAVVWLGLALSLLLLVRLWQRPKALDLLWLANVLVLGSLVKRTFLPLGLVFGVLGLIIFARHSRVILAGFRRVNWQLGVALIVLVLGTGLFAERIGGNLLHYGKIVVSCDEVQGEKACYNFWVNVRARYLAQRQPEKPVPPVEFVVRWFGESFDNIVDIQTQGWRHEVKPARFLTPALVSALFIGLVYGVVNELRRFKTEQQARWRLCVMAIGFFYIAVQLAVNYSSYQHQHVFGLALNGRYILPGLLPLVGLAWFYWAQLLHRRPRAQIILAIAIIAFTVLGSGLLMMLHNPQLTQAI